MTGRPKQSTTLASRKRRSAAKETVGIAQSDPEQRRYLAGVRINLAKRLPAERAKRAAAVAAEAEAALARALAAPLPVVEHKTRPIQGPKPFVFVLMPFHEQFDDVYKVGIKEACESINAYCERVDEQIFEERILDRIYNQIVKADVIVADMTGRNPNVFYEVGFAHALGKRTILLTQSADDIPFDLKHFPHIVYEGKISQLREKLKKRVAWAVASIHSTGTVPDHPRLRYLIQGTQLHFDAKAHIIEYFDDDSKNLVRICQLDIFNDSDAVIDTSQLQLSLVLEHYTGRTAVNLGGGKYRHLLPALGDIFPGACVSSKLSIEPTSSAPHKVLTSKGVPAELHEISRFGRRLIEFRLVLVRRESLEFLVRWGR
ncbi:hypothetical protein HNQ60_004524 [Povalibacter uvarum]|uniref:Nucleoside 2-deoxyribosyltransferase n=1 Tax=Povalibacter uvarum TaxID=732238 RepID=A0A841HS87_9GAMM|nr:hypothetical protein [Povalibacter uvarum]MBB6095633.1 hypothetical protein [Povalibacter uvarum]